MTRTAAATAWKMGHTAHSRTAFTISVTQSMIFGKFKAKFSMKMAQKLMRMECLSQIPSIKIAMRSAKIPVGRWVDTLQYIHLFIYFFSLQKSNQLNQLVCILTSRRLYELISLQNSRTRITFWVITKRRHVKGRLACVVKAMHVRSIITAGISGDLRRNSSTEVLHVPTLNRYTLFLYPVQS